MRPQSGAKQNAPGVFLFTDIEETSRLWAQLPEAMPIVLPRHRALITTAIESAGGFVFKSMDNGVCAVFPEAWSASMGAISAQRALHRTSWSELGADVQLTARFAIQSGVAEAVGADFAGPVLNRLSRLLTAGHNGQILLTGELADEISGDLPTGVWIRRLGDRQLRDVPEPVRIAQLVVDDASSSFQPLRTLDPIPHNLPSFSDLFVGREDEQHHLQRLVESGPTRLVTLLGPGGIGKTRLAIETCGQVLDRFAHGVWLIDLTPVREGGQLSSSIIRVLGLRESAGSSDEAIVLEWLRERHVLLLLDNCEQIFESAATFAETAIRVAPGLRILATSRVPLGIPGEVRRPIDPLSLPDALASVDPGKLRNVASVRLFLSRAQSILPSFSLDSGSAQDIAHICRQVDGIPLAIEIAAARVDTLDLAALRAQLEHRLPTLTGGPRDMPARHQTLRNAIAWSYDLLSAPERHIFDQLGVFAGSWDLAAAEHIVLTSDDSSVADILDWLAGKSLIRASSGIDDHPRFVMLETIREFAIEAAEQGNTRELSLSHHAAYFSAFGVEHESDLYGPDQDAWLERIAIDYANFLAAIDRLTSVDPACAQQLAVVLYRYWFVRGGLSEGLQVLEQVLAGDQSMESLPAGRARHALGNLQLHLSLFTDARESFIQAKEIRRKLGDVRGTAAAEINLGYIARELGDFPGARRHQEMALELLGQSATPEDLGTIHMNLAMLALELHDISDAKSHLEQCLALFRQSGDRYGIANSLARLATVARIEKNNDAARTMLFEACGESERLKDEAGMAYCSQARAMLALAENALPLASREIGSAIDRLHAIGDQKRLLESLMSACQVLSASGNAVAAAITLSGIESGYRQARLMPSPSALAATQEVMLNIQSELAIPDLRRATDEGTGQTLAETVQFCLAALGQVGASS